MRHELMTIPQAAASSRSATMFEVRRGTIVESRPGTMVEGRSAAFVSNAKPIGRAMTQVVQTPNYGSPNPAALAIPRKSLARRPAVYLTCGAMLVAGAGALTYRSIHPNPGQSSR
jgi:hypothetical protein